MERSNTLYLILGWISLALGFVGIFLPLFPTAPFVIVAAYFFQRGSKRWHRWINQHPHFGPLVRNWEDHGVIPTQGKWAAVVGITISLSASLLLLEIAFWAKATAGAVGVAVIVFVLSRPSSPPVPKP